MRRTLFRVLTITASILVALAAGEMVCRLLNVPHSAVSGWRAIDVSASEKNQLGFRGQPIEYADDDFVVVLVGDSQVEAKACSFEWMPERRLQSYLSSSGRKVKVFSVGASGYGQDQELLALREYFEKYRADLVILWETPLNDIWNNLFPTSWPADGTSKPTFWLEQGELRGPSERIGEPIVETPRLKLTLMLRKNFHWSRDKAWESRYPAAYQPLASSDGPVKDDWQGWWTTNGRGMRDENLSTEKTHLAMFLTPRSRRMQYGLDLTRALMREMRGLASAHGARFDAFAVSNPESEEERHSEGVHSLNGKLYRSSLAQYRENLDYWNAGFDFRILPVTLHPSKVGPDNPHLNEHATDQVMSDLAKSLESFITAKQ
ncbi:MAG TPA: hypothetical protein VLJ61_01300 [Pyrinomonadaceae bacterium]|nr:hypothetical protein [Pyrinomonadaceae bacterium]